MAQISKKDIIAFSRFFLNLPIILVENLKFF
ncbi:Uncharacterised protein [Serratia plymuthica]|uniref:Uncharacterized protein n=1 Tax=Serratia plymuthica TaxID=82996 RepID=A0A2X4TUX7_SERPL|nr:Uncharacterised protein [Serratia plymuthica]